MAATQIAFRPFVEINGIYNTGLATVAVVNNGTLATSASLGLMLTWGLSGAHSWKRTRVGLEYRGGVSHYTRKSYYDSIMESLIFGVTQQVNRHIILSFNETAGTFSRLNTPVELSPTVPFDPASSYVPTTDFFDNRTSYSTSHVDLTYQRSLRWSFNFGGDGFVTRRRSAALASVVGEAARGDAEYRVSRRSTIGAGYMFNHYSFTHFFGGTYVHSLYGAYAIQLSRRLELTSYFGAARVEMETIQAVPIDPAIAALLGITSATQIANRTSIIPNFGIRLSRTFHNGVAYLTGGHGITPGNGLFLTSYSTTVTGGYTYTGLRRWSFNAFTQYISNKAIGNIAGTYGGVSGTIAAARQIARSMHFTMSYAARQYQSGTYSNYNRLISEAQVGFAFAPGDIPLRVW